MNFPAYPNGTWVFNPMAWQLLFVFGAWCALGGAERIGKVARSQPVFWIAVAYLAFAFLITMTWYFPRLAAYVPRWFSDWMYPIDKTNLDVLRFAHFLALAILTLRYRAARLVGADVADIATRDSLRSAFTGNFLFGRIPVLRRAFCHGRDIGRPRNAGCGQRAGDRRYGGDGGADIMV